MSDGPTHFRLNTGDLIPSVGLGLWPGYSLEEKGRAGENVKAAIAAGYQHIDCATHYDNQKDVGMALQDIFRSGTLKREELWITSKLWNSDHDRVQDAFEETLNELQLDYLDLYLIHWPVRLTQMRQIGLAPSAEDFAPLKVEETWKQMEKLVQTKRVRAIGVCNFSAKKLDRLLVHAEVVPAVNQVECHPVWQQKNLREYCASKGIHLSGYSPLGNWGSCVLGNTVVKEVATKLGKTPAQVALRWGIQSGHSVLPKSSNPDRLKENLGIYDWTIPEEDLKRFPGIQQERVVKGQGWVNDTTSPYKSLEELWDE